MIDDADKRLKVYLNISSHYSGIHNDEDYFKIAQKIWDEIPISTINALIMSFDSKIKICIMIHGESLNGKKIIKHFQRSYEEGNKYVEKKAQEKSYRYIYKPIKELFQ